MTFEDFITRYANVATDFDGAYGATCVDLFREYHSKVIGGTHTGAVEGAKDIYLNYKSMPVEQKYYKRYGKNRAAKKGDVVIWDATTSNQYGHIAIVVSRVDKETLLVLEQDGFTNTPAKFKLRNRENLLGYLVAK